jgi:hypothetical protein
MKSRDELNAEQWRRVKAYVVQFTPKELERKHHGKLSLALYGVAMKGKPLCGGGRLSSQLITEAMRYCRQAGSTAAGPFGVPTELLE